MRANSSLCLIVSCFAMGSEVSDWRHYRTPSVLCVSNLNLGTLMIESSFPPEDLETVAVDGSDFVCEFERPLTADEMLNLVSTMGDIQRESDNIMEELVPEDQVIVGRFPSGTGLGAGNNETIQRRHPENGVERDGLLSPNQQFVLFLGTNGNPKTPSFTFVHPEEAEAAFVAFHQFMRAKQRGNSPKESTRDIALEILAGTSDLDAPVNLQNWLSSFSKLLYGIGAERKMPEWIDEAQKLIIQDFGTHSLDLDSLSQDGQQSFILVPPYSSFSFANGASLNGTPALVRATSLTNIARRADAILGHARESSVIKREMNR
jgi:hypothetical protein